MKKFLTVFAVVLSMVWAYLPSSASAEYVTARNDVKYDKWIVDTSSIYYPNNGDNTRFNVVVYEFNDIHNLDKSNPYCFKYKFENNQWFIHAGDNWETCESGSVSSDVLKVVIPYLK